MYNWALEVLMGTDKLYKLYILEILSKLMYIFFTFIILSKNFKFLLLLHPYIGKH